MNLKELLCWHVYIKDPWPPRPGTVGGFYRCVKCDKYVWITHGLHSKTFLALNKITHLNNRTYGSWRRPKYET